MTEQPNDKAKEVLKDAEKYWHEFSNRRGDDLNNAKVYESSGLAPLTLATMCIKHCEVGNEAEMLERLKGIVSSISHDEKRDELVDEISKEIKDSVEFETDKNKIAAFKNLQKLFLDEYAL